MKKSAFGAATGYISLLNLKLLYYDLERRNWQSGIVFHPIIYFLLYPLHLQNDTSGQSARH